MDLEELPDAAPRPIDVPVATPDPNPVLIFRASWCSNCGRYVGCLNGEWIHLDGDHPLRCNPLFVVRHKD